MLGRGLAELLPAGGGAGADLAGAAPAREIPVARIRANPDQPRVRFDEAALEELADSIRSNGILQPILVRPIGADYEIVAGERRFRAALRAGLVRVPAVVRVLADDEALAIALVENLVREDIGPLEVAKAYRRLMDEFGWSQEEMGKRVGKSRPAVANSLRLLDLPEPMQAGLEAGAISEGHARALLGDRKLRDQPGFAVRQQALFEEAAAGRLSVRDVERRMAAEARPARPAPSPDIAGIEDLFRSKVGTRVRLVGSLERGRIEIHYYSAEELDALLGRFGDA